MKLNENKKTAINLLSSFIAMAISILINFFLSPYIVKYLGTEANGFTQLANNFVMYASLITIALNSMAGRFITIHYYKNELLEADSYYSTLIIGNIIIILLLVLPSVLIVTNLDKLLHINNAYVNEIKLLFTFVFLNFYVNQICSIYYSSMYVKNKLYISNIVNLLRTLLNGILLFIVFSIFSAHIYYVSLVSLILTLLLLPILILIKKRILPEVIFCYKFLNRYYLYDLITSGIWNTLNQCGNILMTGLDLLFANLFINPIQMGLLAIAKIVPNSIIQIATSINSNYSPNLTITYANNKKNEFISQIRVSMKISSILISTPTMVFCILGDKFYKLWMPTLNERSLTILSFLTIMAFIPLAGPQVLYNVFTTTNKLRWNSITFLISGVLNFCIVFILLQCTNLGIYAVAGVSSTITILRNMFFVFPYTAKLLGLKWYEFYKDVGISMICCLFAGLISYIIKLCIIIGSWFTLIIAVILASIFSLIVNTIIVLNKDEKRKLFERFLRRKEIFE